MRPRRTPDDHAFKQRHWMNQTPRQLARPIVYNHWTPSSQTLLTTILTATTLPSDHVRHPADIKTCTADVRTAARTQRTHRRTYLTYAPPHIPDVRTVAHTQRTHRRTYPTYAPPHVPDVRTRRTYLIGLLHPPHVPNVPTALQKWNLLCSETAHDASPCARLLRWIIIHQTP